MKRDQLDTALLSDCENEIIATADDQLRRSKESAYGTSFPSETKATLARLGNVPKGGTPEDLTKLMIAEIRKWVPIVQALDLTDK